MAPSLRAALAALCAAVAVVTIPVPATAQMGALPSTPMTPIDLAARLSRSCAQHTYVGVCRPPVDLRPRIRMYVPTAFVEVVPRSGQTLMRASVYGAVFQMLAAASTPATGNTGQSRLSLTDNTWDVHVYAIPDGLVNLAGLGPPNMVCTPSDITFPDPAAGASGASSLLDTAACGGVNTAAQKMSQSIASTFDQAAGQALCAPSPRYFSELDVPNWRTGCGDVSLSNLMTSNAFTCTAQSLANFAGAGEQFAGLIGADACVGAWGPLFPRQMRDVGLTGATSAAKAAYRALHLARKTYGTLLTPVGLEGRMQQVQPGASMCFSPGQAPPLATTVNSTDGAYAFVYWHPATCCVPKGRVPACLPG